jgi:hypothetical protein
VDRFVPVTDRSYDDIRKMAALAEGANHSASYQTALA